MDSTIRPLHLHTLDSLCVDLISARPIGVGNDNTPYVLKSDDARSALNWYFSNRNKWAGNAVVPDIEAIVGSMGKVPTSLPVVRQAGSVTNKRYTLRKVTAHRFAGLHRAGVESKAPDDFVYEFHSDLTMFEGFNGSGKTSLLNAIIWALTGEILRPQRSPESAASEFECEIQDASGLETTSHKLTPVMPLPDPSVHRPTAAVIPADTWVELTFEDELGVLQAPVRREQSRSARNRLEEKVTGLTGLVIDPIAPRIGTVMPGMLAFIQLGTESKLGKDP